MKFKRIGAAAIGGAFALLVYGSADAAIVTFNFTGVIDTFECGEVFGCTPPALATTFANEIGKSVTGTFSYDSSVAGVLSAPVYVFSSALKSLTGTIEGLGSFTANGNMDVVLTDRLFSLAPHVGGPEVNDFLPDTFVFNLINSSTVFVDPSVLPTVLALSSFDDSHFDVRNNFNDKIIGHLTELALVTPLPAALPLFATGLGALGLLAWCRKRKQAA